MDRFIVIHYNELGLKKGNRDYFENALCIYQEQSGRDVALQPSTSDSTDQWSGSSGPNVDRCPRCNRFLMSVLWDGKVSGGEYLECQSCGWRMLVDGVDPER